MKTSKLFSRKNVNILVGILAICIAVWLIMYLIPEFFVNLFFTGLGNLVLFLFVIIALMFNVVWGVALTIILFVIYRFSVLSRPSGSVAEGMLGGIAGPGPLFLGGTAAPLLITIPPI